MFILKNDHLHSTVNYQQPKQNQFQQIQPPTPIKKKPRKIKINTLPTNDPNQHYYADALTSQLQASMGDLSNPIFNAISSVRQNLQFKVYTGIVEDQEQYLTRLFNTPKNSKVFVKQLIKDVSADVQKGIMSEIINGDYDVKKVNKMTKNQIFRNKDTATAIRIKQQLLKAKISEFQIDLSGSQNGIQIFNPYNHNLYGANSQRTKQAAEFTKKMQKQQEETRSHYRRIQQNQKEKRKQAQQQKQQFKHRLKQQRHQFLKYQYAQKCKRRQEQKIQSSRQHQQFIQYYKQKMKSKPLFQQKQEEFFQKFVIPENKEKMELLKKRREEYQRLSMDQLQCHEKDYMEIKDDHMYERNAQRMREKSAWNKSRDVYKSKFYSKIQQQEKQKLLSQYNPLDQKTKLYNRRWEYSDDIKSKFEQTSPYKQRQAKRISLQVKGKYKKNVRSIDATRIDGVQNLDHLHKYISGLRAKGHIRYGSASHTIQNSPKKKYQDYLKELRMTKSHMRHSIDYSNLAEKDAEKLKFDLKKKQEDTKRREQYLTHIGRSDMNNFMTEKKKLDEDYLESARAKMAILNKFS